MNTLGSAWPVEIPGNAKFPRVKNRLYSERLKNVDAENFLAGQNFCFYRKCERLKKLKFGITFRNFIYLLRLKVTVLTETNTLKALLLFLRHK